MAGERVPFLTQRPGIEQGRIEPTNFTPGIGSTFAMVLGSDVAGHEREFSVGDRFDIFQSDTPIADAKLIRFAGRLRGPSRMPALAQATELYVLSDGETLLVAVDGGSPQTITFNTGSFADIANARADEVVAVINAQITGATASVASPGAPQILSDETGKGSRIEITGGTAAALSMSELAWKASLLLDGVERASRILRPGETQELADMAGNLATAAAVEVRFRLEVVAL